MKKIIDLVNKAIKKIDSTDTMIQIVSHLDCDGLAAASIMAAGLIEKNKKFQIRFISRISEELIEELKNNNNKLIIFTDLGSGYLNMLKEIKSDIIILDHHQIEGEPSENMIHINPEEVDLKLSGSGITYLLVKEMTNSNALAPLAIVGTIGDVSYPTDSKLFENPLIDAEKGLNLFGRMSRPLHKALEFSNIPGIDEESKAVQFLSEVGINPQKDGDWRTLNDLSEDEKKKLTDAVVKENIKNGKFDKKKIFGDVLTLKNFPGELKDGKEFATILNACANMNEPATGVALCLGNGKNLESAKKLLRAYRKVIGNYKRWVESHPEFIKNTENASYIMGQDEINENFIGTIVSMTFREQKKTLIGFGNSSEGIKVSARTKDVNIKDVMVKAAEVCGGLGGGHENAAGAIIPIEAQEKFIEACERLMTSSKIKSLSASL